MTELDSGGGGDHGRVTIICSELQSVSSLSGLSPQYLLQCLMHALNKCLVTEEWNWHRPGTLKDRSRHTLLVTSGAIWTVLALKEQVPPQGMGVRRYLHGMVNQVLHFLSQCPSLNRSLHFYKAVSPACSCLPVMAAGKRGQHCSQ